MFRVVRVFDLRTAYMVVRFFCFPFNKSNITKNVIVSAIFNIKKISEKVLIFAEPIKKFYILVSLNSKTIVLWKTSKTEPFTLTLQQTKSSTKFVRREL